MGIDFDSASGLQAKMAKERKEALIALRKVPENPLISSCSYKQLKLNLVSVKVYPIRIDLNLENVALVTYFSRDHEFSSWVRVCN